MIERCSSGALTYPLAGSQKDVEPPLAAGVGVVDDGPLWVTGSVPVERADGLPLQVRPRMTLCRCGASANKPLCDGSHARTGFADGPHVGEAATPSGGQGSRARRRVPEGAPTWHVDEDHRLLPNGLETLSS